MLRSTVESVRSRCQRETGSLSARCCSSALASPRLPSEFSKSIGLTLCGIVDEPISPAFSLLLEIAERDVAPDVAIEVEQDRIRARESVEQLGHVVVRLDLDRVRVERRAPAAPRRRPARTLPSRSRDRPPGARCSCRRRRSSCRAVRRRDAPIARCSRAATFAISLPSVVGLAGWPCVRDSIGTSACTCASSTRRRCTERSAGSITSSRAP